MSKTGSVAPEEKLFENVNGRTDRWRDDGQKVTTIAHPEHTYAQPEHYMSQADGWGIKI